MIDEDLDKMAKDEKTVEKTRAAIQAKNLKRIVERKRKFRNIILSTLTLGILAVACDWINDLIVEGGIETDALQLRDQGLRESRLVEDIRYQNQLGREIEANYKKKQAKKRLEQEKLQAEQDYKECHWLNVLIVMKPGVAKHAERIIDKTDKPHIGHGVYPYEGCDQKHMCVFMVTRELEDILKDKGIRYQRKEFKDNKEILEFNRNLESNVFGVLSIEPFINW